MGKNLPFAWADGFGVNGHDNTLAAEFICRAGHHIGVCYSRGIKADLIGACQKQIADIFHCAHPTTYGQWHETLLRGAGGQIIHGAAVFMRGMDV